jgi:hypothetical protein
MTAAENATAFRIATMIATLVENGTCRDHMMLEISQLFPFASLRVFVAGLSLFEAQRARDMGRLH